MRKLVSQSILATALLLGASGCSDDSDEPGATGGSAGSMESDGTAGSAGAAGSDGMAASAGAAGSNGLAGSAGAAGSDGMAASAGAAGGAGTSGADFPVPDKLAALTFDDGPSATLTPPILDKLEAHQVPATFFLIGQNVTDGAQAVLERAADLGCEFGNHSFGYAALTGLSREEIETSVGDTNAAIEPATGTTPVFFRPPNLAIDANMYEVIDMPFAGGLVGGDFPAEFGGNPTVQAVTDTVLNGVQDGSIILLHDVQPQLDPQPTPDALDVIIPELKRRGYELVTLGQLFERSGVDPNSQQDSIWNRVPPPE